MKMHNKKATSNKNNCKEQAKQQINWFITNIYV